MLNSFKVTIPTVIGAVALSLMTGFALAVYKFKSNLLLFFMFVAGNFVPFQILMVPVRDLTLQPWHVQHLVWAWRCSTSRSRPGFCTLFMRNFIKALPFELIEAARVEGVIGMAHLRYIVAAADAAGHRRAFGARLHLHLERFLLGHGSDARAPTPSRSPRGSPRSTGNGSRNGTWCRPVRSLPPCRRC